MKQSDLEQINNKFITCENKTSIFLSLEGIEGSGKSTHIGKIKSYLEALKYNVLVVREPGGTEFGELLRKAILNSNTPIEAISEAYLFAASRAQLLKEVILPFLKKDRSVVICDRYIDSSIAYQGIARNIGINSILNIHTFPPLNILPTKTFYIKISYKTSQDRQEKRKSKKDYFESQNANFYNSLITGYDKAAEIFRDRISIIDGEKNTDEVFNEIKIEIDKIIKNHD